ncbi:MAG: hypothetical protein E7671_06445, partial [Ruminococcaceae bacterium]|nr:hypothetical protein [Oscillospiraceae bacterium]
MAGGAITFNNHPSGTNEWLDFQRKNANIKKVVIENKKGLEVYKIVGGIAELPECTSIIFPETV